MRDVRIEAHDRCDGRGLSGSVRSTGGVEQFFGERGALWRCRCSCHGRPLAQLGRCYGRFSEIDFIGDNRRGGSVLLRITRGVTVLCLQHCSVKNVILFPGGSENIAVR